MTLYRYFKNIGLGRTILWCYVIWYLVMATFHFDPSPRIWLTSLGISAVIGIALILSVAPQSGQAQSDRWQTMRLFLMPFCVSSFAALVKGKGFILIFSPVPLQTGLALGLCLAFFASVQLIKRFG